MAMKTPERLNGCNAKHLAVKFSWARYAMEVIMCAFPGALPFLVVFLMPLARVG